MGVYALVFMVLDHTACYLQKIGVGDPLLILFFHALGRLSVPLYLYQAHLVYGLISQKPGEPGRYISRLFFLAILSEIPYQLFFGHGGNFIMVIAVVVLLDHLYRHDQRSLFLMIFICFFDPKYLYYYLFYASFALDKPERFMLQSLCLYSQVGAFGVLGMCYVFVVRGWPSVRLCGGVRWAYRYFYPAHLAGLYLLTKG